MKDKIDKRIEDQLHSSSPTVPEHFRRIVEEAVAVHMENETQTIQTMRADNMTTDCNNTQSNGGGSRTARAHQTLSAGGDTPSGSSGSRTVRPRKNLWRRFLLPAAAVLTVGGVVAAAGSSYLKDYLHQLGFGEAAVNALIETEPEQKVTELTDTASLSYPVVEREWEKPLLTIREACFDGESLCFLAEGSEESSRYDLTLKDHASLNGYDGYTRLQKTEEENLWFGQIRLFDPADGDGVLSSDTVKVTMTVMAYPNYEGEILYTWRDVDAYRELYGIDPFTWSPDETVEPVQFCVAPFKEVTTGYTPHQITVDVTLDESAREEIEQYRAKAEAAPAVSDSAGQDASDLSENGADQNASSLSESSAGQDASDLSESTEAADATQSVNSADSAETGDFSDLSADNALQNLNLTEDHVTCELRTQTGILPIDADLIQRTDQVSTGTLRISPLPNEKLFSLLDGSSPDGWTLNEESGSWQYGDELIFASSSYTELHYQNDAEQTGTSESLSAEQADALEICRKSFALLGTDSEAVLQGSFDGENTQWNFKVVTLLEGLPVSSLSQWPISGSATVQNGRLTSLNAPAPLEAADQQPAEIADFSVILQRLAEYAAAGEITALPDGQGVSSIELQYYVDLTSQGLVYRPVWIFHIPYLFADEQPTAENLSTEKDYLCIDAVTGAFIRDLFKW